jgi:hypothetical protein
MKLLMVEMMGGTKCFVGEFEDIDGFKSMKNVVEVKEIIAPGPNGPACYHLGVLIGTMKYVNEDNSTPFDLDKDSPFMSCYTQTMNAAVDNAKTKTAHMFDFSKKKNN